MKGAAPPPPGGPPPEGAGKKEAGAPPAKGEGPPEKGGKGDPLDAPAPLSPTENLRLVWRLRSLFLPYLLPAAGVLVLALLQADLALTATTATQQVFDRIASGAAAAGRAAPSSVTVSEALFRLVADGASLPVLAGLVAAFLLLSQVFGIVLEQVRSILSERFRQRLQVNLVNALSWELASTRAKRTSGNTSQIFMTDAGGLSGLLIFGLLRAAENVVKMGVYVFGLTRIEGGWTIVAVVFPALVLFQSAVARVFLYREARVTERGQQILVALRSRTVDFFENLSRLVYFKGERAEADRLLYLAYRSGVGNRRFQLLASLHGIIAGLVATLALPLVVLTLRDNVSVGTIAQAQAQVMLLVGTVGALVGLPAMLSQFSPSMRRIEEILSIPKPEPQPAELARLRAQPGPARVTIENLSFAYPGSARPVLDDITLEIPAGSCIGIVGRSGCGKSTLARLLMGDLKPTSGRILVDGVDVTSWHLVWRRELFGFMPAEPGFLRGTLEDNVLFGRDRGLVANWEGALAASGVATIARRREDEGGMQFLIDGRVEDILSTGERKRVGIARLLVGTQRCGIFDEPGNGLDPQTMVEVAGAFRAAMSGRTTVLITHDPDVFSTDCVVYLEAGRIAGMGPHASLRQSNADYRRMVDRNADEREERTLVAAGAGGDEAGGVMDV